MIHIDPWARGQNQKDFGKLECFKTADFEMPPENLSDLKKVDLLIHDSDESEQSMALVYQYADSLWSVPLSGTDKPQKLLPKDSVKMSKRLTVRNKTMETCVYCAAYDVET